MIDPKTAIRNRLAPDHNILNRTELETLMDLVAEEQTRCMEAFRQAPAMGLNAAVEAQKIDGIIRIANKIRAMAIANGY
jgi:hypothetical protein